jgi:hypothetical protein
MSNALIELAKKKKAAAEQIAQRLQEELRRAEQEVMEWQSFIDRAQSLASGSPPPSPKRVSVQRESIAGMCAKLVMAKGPLSLKSLVAELRNAGKGHGSDNFSTVVNSALWRRREDLFEKKEDGLYHLRTEDIDFVD